MTRVVTTVEDLRAGVAEWRGAGERVAVVPTMGALHAGHLHLVQAAKERADRVVVTIFVNPAQFAPHEDFDRYPRTLETDVAALRDIGAELAYAPTAADMYPSGHATSLAVTGPAEGLETDFRPHFFGGVATVVAKLFLRVLPDLAFFGEKDYQQLLVVKRMVADLDMPMEVVGVPTVREEDGLALSSRNAYLSEEERMLAPLIYAELQAAAERIVAGDNPEEVAAASAAALTRAGFAVDYVAARNAETLAPVRKAGEPVRLLAAARIGNTRLIDNIGV
ncbi:MAG TPA: pantoate--beta-alanine ligase [Kaistiaceae bacterium]|nr:pantoate--beta-alanine ligase [Kaistiaceae bacterium]